MSDLSKVDRMIIFSGICDLMRACGKLKPGEMLHLSREQQIDHDISDTLMEQADMVLDEETQFWVDRYNYERKRNA